MVAKRKISLNDRIYDEEEFKDFLVTVLAKRVGQYENQSQCAKAWGVTQPTINYIVNGKLDSLTLKQLCNIAWKSGAGLEIGVWYGE